MGYMKAIVFGDNLELYKYEKDIRYNGRSGVSVKGRTRVLVLAQSGSVEYAGQVQKRRDNEVRARGAFARLVIANTSLTSTPVLLTLTYASNMQDIRKGYKDFNSFIGVLRYHYGKGFRYIAVPEFQRRGALHFHTLIWGLPEDLCESERRTRVVAKYWGHGFIDLYKTNGSEKLAWYLAKYMSKSYLDDRLYGIKAYRCSRNIIRPIHEKNLVGTWYLSERWGLTVDNPACVVREFQSKWLGKGRYLLYKNLNHTDENSINK